MTYIIFINTIKIYTQYTYIEAYNFQFVSELYSSSWEFCIHGVLVSKYKQITKQNIESEKTYIHEGQVYCMNEQIMHYLAWKVTTASCCSSSLTSVSQLKSLLPLSCEC